MILIKDESKNPFRTFKDRRSELIIREAKEDYVDKLVLITSGNAGYSLSKFSEKTTIKVVCVVDKKLKESIKKVLKDSIHKLIEVDLSKRILKPEEIIFLARENEEEVIWDVTNGFHKAYEKIIDEIKKENPKFIVVPVGSGEAFVGLYNKIKQLKMKTKLIGIGTKNKNSFADKLSTPWIPYKSKIQSILKEGNKIIKLNEEEIKDCYKKFKRLVDCEPSSAVVFSFLNKIKLNSKVILINSGKGLF